MIKSSLAVALTMAGASLAHAEAPSSYYLGGAATAAIPSDLRDASGESPGAQLYFGLPLHKYPGWAVELNLAWNELERDSDGGSDELRQATLDLLRYWRTDSALSPFVLAGIGASDEDVSGNSATRPVLGLGGGVHWDSGWHGLGLRFDARALAQENDFTDADGNEVSGRALLVDGRVSLGLNWDFAAAGPATAGDADNDGVIDSADLCPETAPDLPVDVTGCETVVSHDTDADGIPDSRDHCPGTPVGEAVDVSGCAVVDAVVLEGVNFAYDSTVLTQEAKDILDQAAELLISGLRGLRIEIAGHTDNRGTADYNQALSARRASAVKQYLIAAGVSAGRLVATGYGATRPVADNATEAGRAKNRRVVFRALD